MESTCDRLQYVTFSLNWSNFVNYARVDGMFYFCVDRIILNIVLQLYILNETFKTIQDSGSFSGLVISV